MREMLHFMKISCFPYGKRILASILLAFLPELLLCFMAFHHGGEKAAALLLLLGGLACYLVFAVVNHKRYHHFAGLGGLQRIRLLPQPRQAFVYGELLFSFAFVLLICLLQYVICFLLLPLAEEACALSADSYAYAPPCPSLQEWVPCTLEGALQTLSFLLMISALELWVHIHMETVKEGVYRWLLIKLLLSVCILPWLFGMLLYFYMFGVLSSFINSQGDTGSALFFGILYAGVSFLLIRNSIHQLQREAGE